MLTESTMKEILEKTLIETKETRKLIEDINYELHSSEDMPDRDTVLRWARQVTGAGNYILGKYKKLCAVIKNEKGHKYAQLQIEADSSGQKFVSSVATQQASHHVANLRLTRDILEASVESAKNIVSICRMHIKEEQSNLNTTI